MKMQKLKLELTLAEAELVLNSLAKQPYETVAPLINGIHEQARAQMQPQQHPQPEPEEVVE
jgi:hypothetical protein